MILVPVQESWIRERDPRPSRRRMNTSIVIRYVSVVHIICIIVSNLFRTCQMHTSENNFSSSQLFLATVFVETKENGNATKKNRPNHRSFNFYLGWALHGSFVAALSPTVEQAGIIDLSRDFRESGGKNLTWEMVLSRISQSRESNRSFLEIDARLLWVLHPISTRWMQHAKEEVNTICTRWHTWNKFFRKKCWW